MIIHRIEINAPRKVVFARYEDIESWPAWDSETLAVHLRALCPDTSGWLKPRQGPKVKIRVAEIVPNLSFTIEGLLPFCRMQFGHELQGDADRTTATHWVRFVGPLAFLFQRLIGRGIDRTLPHTLAGLKRLSEQKGPSQ